MFKAHTTKKIIIRLIFYQRDLKKKVNTLGLSLITIIVSI